MIRYVVVGVSSGVLFGVMDGLINANPLAQRLYIVFRPIARESVNVRAGILIDVLYGFAMAGIFCLLYPSLPGQTGVLKGLAFGAGAWFFRVLMPVAGQWVTLKVPAAALWYTLLTGLGEMLVLGALYGLSLRPPAGWK